MLIASLPLRLLRRVIAVVLLAALGRAAFAQSAIDGFNPNVDGIVYAVATQPDGKILVGGQFTSFRGRDGHPQERRNLARLNVDGSVDDSFAPQPDGPVRTLVLQANGQLLVGGEFTKFEPRGGTAITRNSIARLNAATGAIDAGFDPNITLDDIIPRGAIVYAIALQPDGKVIVGGLFRKVRPNGAAVAFDRTYIARFNSDGSLDTAFDPHPDRAVYAIAFHIDNKIVIGGDFTSFWEAGAPTPSTRNYIARLNPNGVLDSEFNLNPNNVVSSLAIQRDGKILMGGHFTTLSPPVDSGAATNRGRLARLNPNGSVDTEFYPSFAGGVTSISVAPDGSIFTAGNFTSVWTRGTGEVAHGYTAKLNPDGTLDTDYKPLFNSPVNCIAFQSDGKIVVGGQFTRVAPTGSTLPLERNRLARLDGKGRVDASFELADGGRVLASAEQSFDGKIVVGGSFTNLGGATHRYLARLGADGAVESGFAPDLNDRVYAVAVQANRQIIAGGAFTTANGVTRNRIARFNADGTLDTGFDPNLNGIVGAIVVQADGKILVGGTFSTAQPNGASTTTSRSNILRLNTDGTLDTAFDPTANSTVASIALAGDKIYIAGAFTTLTPGFTANTSAALVGRSYLAKLNADGTVDTAFNTSFNARLSVVLVQGDGNIVVGGSFTQILENGASEAVTRNRIARLDTAGKIDTAFNPNANGNVFTIVQRRDSKLLIGGAFTTLQPDPAADWIGRRYIALLNTDGKVDTAFNLDINEQPGNYVDSLNILKQSPNADRILVGGSFPSVHPAGTATRLLRRNLVLIEQAGPVVTAFDLSVGGAPGGTINALAVQSDGRVLAVGDFKDIGGAKSTNIARFDPEGAPDLSFDSALVTDGAVNAVAVRPNAAASTTQLPGFAWFERDARLRASFATGTDASRLRGRIDAVAVQQDGSLIVGGAFNDITNEISGNLLRYRANGQRDTSFSVKLNGAVSAIALQPDGKILIGGAFTTVNDLARPFLARLNSDGSFDSGFDPSPNARINSIVILGDKIYLGGAFTTLTPGASTATTTTPTATSRAYLARLNLSDAAIDTGYNPTANGAVNVLVPQGDKMLVGGVFNTFQPNSATTLTSRTAIARINADGTVDEAFDPNPDGAVIAIAVQSDNKIVFGGSFTSLTPYMGTTTTPRSRLARVNNDGTLDVTFNPSPNADVLAVAVQADGAIVFGGAFTGVQPGASGSTSVRNHLARVNADGSLDAAFNPDMNDSVSVIKVQSDGSLLVGGGFSGIQANAVVLVGGSFANISGVSVGNIAMLNSSGSINAAFQLRANGAVNALLSLSDGSAIVGGAFTTFGGATRNRLAKLNADASLNTTFNPNVDGTISALALQRDGKVIVGGSFNNIGGRAQANVARLNADGTVDTAFVAANIGLVRALAVQPDGRILVVTTAGGVSTLTRLAGTGAPDGSAAVVTGGGAIETLALQADGRIVLGGSFTSIGGTGIARAARLAADLSLEAGFNPAPNGPVTAIAIQSDGRMMLAGRFSSVAGTPRFGLARIATTESATQILGIAADRSAVVWNRGGAGGEVATASFELSLDRATWSRLGEGQRIGNTSDWRIATNALPTTGLFYIRVRGIAPSSSGRSSGLFETVREFSAVPGVGSSADGGVQADGDIGFLSGELSARYARSIAEAIAAAGGGSSGGPDGGGLGASGVRLANLSLRTRVTAAQPTIMGFSVSGGASRQVLIRAVGPGLQPFGVTGTLSAPRIKLYNSAGAVLSTQVGWSASINELSARVGAFPLTAGSNDAAFATTLPAGTYSIHVESATGAAGTVLTEVYDAGTGEGRLVNLSSRSAVVIGDAYIGGLVVTGNTEKRLLVRAVGPSLARFGVSGAIADPVVTVFRGNSPVASNDDWSSAEVVIAGAQVGAFPLATGTKDAAVVVNVTPGPYTIQVSGAGTGEALLEVYELP